MTKTNCPTCHQEPTTVHHPAPYPHFKDPQVPLFDVRCLTCGHKGPAYPKVEDAIQAWNNLNTSPGV